MGLPQGEIYTKMLSNKIIKNPKKLNKWSKRWNLAKIGVTSLNREQFSK